MHLRQMRRSFPATLPLVSSVSSPLRFPRLLRKLTSVQSSRHTLATTTSCMTLSRNIPEEVPHEQRAWEWFNRLGAPKFWVAPMVDQSELAFRMLCLRHGATGAYTPMLHARLFVETPSYRQEHFTTHEQDRCMHRWCLEGDETEF
jgi:hypothetical protein